MEDLVIVGSGGLAREFRALIESINGSKNIWNILGWISNDKPGTIIAGIPVIGDDEWIINRDNPINVVVAIGDGKIRKKIIDSYKKNKKVFFPNIVSDKATIYPSTEIGEGCVITDYCVLTVDIKIGDFFISNLSCTIGHDTVIKDFVTLNPGAHVSGNVFIENCVYIGTGANIIQGLAIGENTIIGAGAVVVKDIPANCTAVGVPARPINS